MRKEQSVCVKFKLANIFFIDYDCKYDKSGIF